MQLMARTLYRVSPHVGVHVQLQARRSSRQLGPAAACAVLVLGHLIGGAPSLAGECPDWDNAQVIIRELSQSDPDDLSSDGRYLLGCLDSPLDNLGGERPSWRVLRNTRRQFRDLGRNTALIDALRHLRRSLDPYVRSNAAIALALYGQHSYCDSLAADGISVSQRAMVLAVVGEPSGVTLAIAAYPTDERKHELLATLYFQGTPQAIDCIAQVARTEGGAPAGRRARWMLDHPVPVKESWKL